MAVTPLEVGELRWQCCEQQFEFDSTEQLDALDGPIGQERAMTAIDLSLGMPNHGFNLFVTGRTGTGRTSAIRQILEERAKGEPIPEDWCYIHDLDQGASPKAFSVPHGVGKQVQEDMAELIRRLADQLPKLFKSKEYEQYKGKITEEFQLKSKKLLEDLEQKAAVQGFEIQRSVSGLVLVPTKDGEALTQAEYDGLDEAVADDPRGHEGPDDEECALCTFRRAIGEDCFEIDRDADHEPDITRAKEEHAGER